MRIVKIDTLPSKVALSIKPRIRIVKRNQASQEKYNLYKCEQIDQATCTSLYRYYWKRSGSITSILFNF